MFDEKEKEIISKHSSGVSILIRINSLWIDTHVHSRNGNYSRWDLDLDRIWLELARDLKENSYKLYQKDMEKFNKEIKEIGGFCDEKPQGFKPISQEIINNRSKVYDVLMEKQIYLARLENKLGKGTTEKSDDDDDMD